jgi:hypothetical protein
MLLENVGSCTTPHGITSHNTLAFNTVAKPSDLQHRSSKETTITFEAICKYHAAKQTAKTSTLIPKDTQRRNKSQK